MGFNKLLAFTKKVADFADQPSGTPAEIKAQFDAAPDEVRQYLNSLIDALKSSAAGDSGAKNIGAAAISGVEGTDVQTLLEKLKDLSTRGAFYGKGSGSFNGGFLIFPVNQWITELNSEFFSLSGNSNIVFKKSGLYEVNFSCTRSDLIANHYWNIGFAINNDSAKTIKEEMVMGQYSWNQSGGPNLTKVPLSLNHLVRVNANDYINFNNNSQDGPRTYDLKFNVKKISD